MLARNGSPHPNNKAKKPIERHFGRTRHRRIRHVTDHQIHMNVAVTRMTETSNGNPSFSLQLLAKNDQLDQPATRHDHVFIQLGQPGVAQTVGKFTALGPQPLHRRLIRRRNDRQRTTAVQHPR